VEVKYNQAFCLPKVIGAQIRYVFSLILGMSNAREMYNLCLAFVKEKMREINVRGDVKDSMKGM
jgi:hypothetical protein